MPVPTNTGCPDEVANPPKIDVTLTVAFWCHPNGLFLPDGSIITDQVQWKMRLVLRNTTDKAVAINIDKPSDIRLIIDDDRDIPKL